jgi:hypothetical protein
MGALYGDGCVGGIGALYGEDCGGGMGAPAVPDGA